MTDNGREDPAFFITNDDKTDAAEIVSRYAEHLNRQGRAVSTIQNRISTINVILSYETVKVFPLDILRDAAASRERAKRRQRA
jgi:hypothetical protein